MGRGIRLACEQCDFSAEVVERAPFVVDASGDARALPAESGAAPDGYWSDWLCGECRLPVRLSTTEREAPAGASADPAPRCPTCGTGLLAFDEAARELAEASHSRVWRDLAIEREGAARVRIALGAVAGLDEQRSLGEYTTQGALDALAAKAVPRDDALRAAELASSVALGGLDTLIENAADLVSAQRLLAEREEMSRRHIGILEGWCANEAELPGVPCPRCGTGQLVHWPVWE